MMRRMLFVAVLLMLQASAVEGQYAADQPKSLKGIRTVLINFAEPNAKMDANLREEMFENAVLELRKSGIRVVREPTPDQTADALVNLTVFVLTGLNDFVRVRMDVEQKVIVVRTGEALQLVTWYFEDTSDASSWRSAAKPLALKATNKLISDWLDANSR